MKTSVVVVIFIFFIHRSFHTLCVSSTKS